jgi:hypothetical protein
MWWNVYVRWSNGRRETIRTQTPSQLPSGGGGRLWVLACLPVPTVSVRLGR